MKNNNPEDIQTRLEEKASKRQKKNKPKMKVTGRSVKNLQKIIIAKKNGTSR